VQGLHTETRGPAQSPPRPPIDFKAVNTLAMANLPAWVPRILGRRFAYYPPGSVAWWPSPADGVHMFDGGPRAIFLGDWSGRWRWGEAWGTDMVDLLARLRGCRQGQAAALLTRTCGVPDVPRLAPRGVYR
jgi:hypothetical protein